MSREWNDIAGMIIRSIETKPGGTSRSAREGLIYGLSRQLASTLGSRKIHDAAPDLLAACQGLLNVIDELGGDCPVLFRDAEAHARAAIAKATITDDPRD